MLSKLLSLLMVTTVLGISTVHAMDEREDAPQEIAHKNLPYTDPSYQSKRADISVLKSYFRELSEHIDSYRTFAIWSSGERKLIKDYKSYIGGTSKKQPNRRAVTWFNLNDDFLEASKEFKGKFILELMLDKKTFNDNSENIETLQKNHPNSVKITFIEDVLEEVKPQISTEMFSLLEHLEKGNPALGSDILRILLLCNPEYALNVYSDPDSFVRHLKFTQKSYRPKDAKEDPNLSYQDIFLAELTAAKTKRAQLFRTLYCSSSTNDYLLSKGNTLEQLGKSMNQWEDAFAGSPLQLKTLDWYKTRSDYFSDYATYSEKFNTIFQGISEKFQRGVYNRIPSIDLDAAIMHLTGPGASFYLDKSGNGGASLLFTGILKNRVLLVSKGSWSVNRKYFPVQKFDDFCLTMQGMYGENGTQILTSLWKTRWMIHDWDMMTLTGQHENVRKELKAAYLEQFKELQTLVNTAPMRFQENAKNQRSNFIQKINSDIENSKILYSTTEGKFYLL